jgi:hypothetical protein
MLLAVIISLAAAAGITLVGILVYRKRRAASVQHFSTLKPVPGRIHEKVGCPLFGLPLSFVFFPFQRVDVCIHFTSLTGARTDGHAVQWLSV